MYNSIICNYFLFFFSFYCCNNSIQKIGMIYEHQIKQNISIRSRTMKLSIFSLYLCVYDSAVLPIYNVELNFIFILEI